MIGYLQGTVLSSDGKKAIILTNSGIGYEIQFNGLIREGKQAGLFIAHIIRENLQDLYGFSQIKDKKIFEYLLKVNGVGPKSAYSLIVNLGAESVCEAVLLENKKVLQSAPGIGPKAAAQIILDLKNKMKDLMLQSDDSVDVTDSFYDNQKPLIDVGRDIPIVKDSTIRSSKLLKDSMLACCELGFKEEDVLPLLRKGLKTDGISTSEDLVRMVLREFGQ